MKITLQPQTSLWGDITRTLGGGFEGNVEKILRGGAGILGRVANLPDFGVSEGGRNNNYSPVLGPADEKNNTVDTSLPKPTGAGAGAGAGAKVGNTGNGNTGNGNTGNGSSSFPAGQYIGWDPKAAEADWKAKGSSGGQTNGGQGTQSMEDLISEQYGPALQALREIEDSLLGGKTEALGNVGADFTSGMQTIGNEQGDLEKSLSEQGRRLGESARSAYADATRAYNNLVQQGMSKFGAGSSAGGAVNELVNQEFLRSRGAMGQQEVQGQADLGIEQNKLNTYISQKKTDLDKWQRDAVLAINKNFTDSMNEINGRKADIEANKTRDRIAALQGAVSQAQAIKTADKQYRMGLAQFAVEQMQTFANRAFTPQEIASVVNQMMSQELGAFSENTSTTPQTFQNFPTTKKGPEYDEFGNLKNPLAKNG